MREVLFRGKSVTGQEEINYKILWVYGFLIRDGAGGWIVTPEMEWIEVQPETVGQFTGLLDKNGKRVFEGDLVKHGSYCNYIVSEPDEIDAVDWGETGDSDGWSHGGHQEFVVAENSLYDVHATCEVVGNVWDNGEMLEQS